MKFTPLLSEEAAKQDYTHRLDFSYKDIPAGIANNTSTTWNVTTLPAATIFYGAKALLDVAFEDLSDSAFNDDTFSLGDDGSATRFFSGVQINRNGTEVYDSLNVTPYQYASAGTLILTLNSMTAKSLSNLDKGQMSIFLKIGNENRAALIDAQGP